MAGVAEVYLPAFGLALGMSAVAAGLLATAPLIAGGLLQLLAPRTMQRVRSLRSWVSLCTTAQALVFAPLIVVALTGTPATGVVYAATALYWAAGMATAAGWTPWMARVVPARVRSRFFGRRQGVVQAAMLSGMLGAGLGLHAASGTRHVLDVYAAMFGLAMVARLASAVAVARMGQGVELEPQPALGLRAIAARLRRSSRARPLGYLIAALAAASVAGPFITPYLLAHHHLEYARYSAFTATILVVKIAAMPRMGGVLERVGLRRVITACALAIAPIPLMWLVSDAFWWFLCSQVYSGVAWAGFELAMLMALLDADDDAERTSMQVAFSALQALGTTAASLVGGAVLGALGSDHRAYLTVFALSALARLAAAMLLVRRLPALLVRLPIDLVASAWTLAIRPASGSLLRSFVEGLARRRRDRNP